MLHPSFAITPLLLLFAAPASPPPPAVDWGRAAALTQHFVVHVPRMTITRTTTIIIRGRPVAPPPVQFVERKAKDCIEMQRLVGFGITKADSVDLVLRDGSRVRALLGNRCPSLGYYQGFYIKPHPDGKMCAGRDVIRTRSGGTCSVQTFKTLVPVR
jgi:hypothetical protein